MLEIQICIYDKNPYNGEMFDENPIKIHVNGFYFTQFAGLQPETYYGLYHRFITELDDNAPHVLCL